MKLYNTLGRKLEEFKPIEDGKVKLYTCGPTVYDNQTIGNFRTFVFYDTLRRLLEFNNYKVNHVMNITDVGHLTSDADEGEDKLEKGAKREGSTAVKVAEKYTASFLSGMKIMNILEPKYARATDYVPEQIELVKLLLDKDFAYKTEQAIYFDVSKLSDYGKLTGQKLDEKEIAARSEVTADSNKRNPQDFALWFLAVGRYANHEMRWYSPWGQGFPGWHAECSSIVHKTLGEPIDIHAGGVDLIGTHHTNEMAQTEAAYGKELANYWIHSEHLLVNGERMSKSSGNFYTLQDVEDKGYDPVALRLLYLQSHYRSQMNFTWGALDAAQANLKSLLAFADLSLQPQEISLAVDYNQYIKEILENLSDDMNSPKALAILNSLANEIAAVPSRELGNFKAFIEAIEKLFGIKLTNREDISDAQKNLIAEREAARQSKNWDKADMLRNKLLEQGIEINDTPSGPIWSRS